MINKHLMPTFGDSMLRELTPMTLQTYFSGLKASHASAMKMKDALASVLNSAVKFGLLVKNPLENVLIPRPRIGKRSEPYLTPESSMNW